MYCYPIRKTDQIFTYVFTFLKGYVDLTGTKGSARRVAKYSFTSKLLFLLSIMIKLIMFYDYDCYGICFMPI